MSTDKVQIMSPRRFGRQYETDVSKDMQQILDHRELSAYVKPTSVKFEYEYDDQYQIHAHDPLSANVVSKRAYQIEQAGIHFHIKTKTTVQSDAEQIHVVNDLEAFEDGRKVFETSRPISIPRDLW